MSALTESQLLGQRIRLLGVSAPIDLSDGSNNTRIFVAGDVQNRAPEGVTFVAFVGITYNGGTGNPPATVTLRLGNLSTIATSGNWKNTFNANSYSVNPTIIYAADGEDPVLAGDWGIRVVAAGSGTAVARAYGWTI